jgi:hypothetical protein
LSRARIIVGPPQARGVQGVSPEIQYIPRMMGKLNLA